MRHGYANWNLAAMLLACGHGATAQQTATIHTQQTTVVLQAGAEAPRLASLGNGQAHPWVNRVSENLIDSAEVNGHSVRLRWKLDASKNEVAANHALFVYECAEPQLQLTWKWEARAGHGPIEHAITIENLSSNDIWIPLQDSFRFRFNVEAGEALTHAYIDKGTGRPSEVGTHQTAAKVGYHWKGRSSSYAKNTEEREIIPWSLVERDDPAQDGWYVGVEFSGRTRLTLGRTESAIAGVVGLNPDPGPFRARLKPNESFATAPIFVGAFSGGVDGMANELRPWVREVLNNPATWKNPAYPTLVNNSWGSGMQIDEALAQRMLRDSAELGLELFALDAGWFRGVGDWYPNPAKFPHGLAPIAEEAHQRGLKFGIWVDWAQAGVDTEPGALNVNDPKVKDWLVADTPVGWKPDDFVGRTIDIGLPPAKEYAQREVERLVTDYHLDMLEHDGYLVAKNCAGIDHPHAVASPPQMSMVKGNGILMPDASNSSDVNYHAVHAYYDIYSHTRQQHPELIFEICNDGGRMVDFGSASHGDYFSITDTYDPLSNRRAFYDASYVLPSAMLEDYVEKWPVPRIENFRYMLRSGMMGWLTIMQDTNAWTAEQHTTAKEEFQLYKQELRPFIRDASLYHVSARPDGVRWDGMEYFDATRDRGVLYAFRGSTANEVEHTFRLQGLRSDRSYRLRFRDHSSTDRTVSGSELLKSGFTVALPYPLSSELVFVDEAEGPA